MKALTIWQPWASLVIAGAKPFEFRSWRAPRSLIGQRVVVHAAARKIDRDECAALFGVLSMRDLGEQLRIAAAETCLIPDKAIPILNFLAGGELPTGAGIGTAIVGEPRHGTDIAADFGVPRANDSDRDDHANWGWPMLEIEQWPEPIPMRGQQGIWNWPDPMEAGL